MKKYGLIITITLTTLLLVAGIITVDVLGSKAAEYTYLPMLSVICALLALMNIGLSVVVMLKSKSWARLMPSIYILTSIVALAYLYIFSVVQITW